LGGIKIGLKGGEILMAMTFAISQKGAARKSAAFSTQKTPQTAGFAKGK